MIDLDDFIKVSGSIFIDFVKPSNAIKAFPIVIFYSICGAITHFVFVDNILISALFIGLMSAIPIARYSIPASIGDIDSNWFSKNIAQGESLQFYQRYCLSCVTWMTPLYLLYKLLVQLGGEQFSLNPSDSSTSNFTALLLSLLLLGVVFFVATIISSMIAAASHETRDVVSFNPWKLLLIEQYDNLLLILGYSCGSILVLWLIYSIPFAAIIYLISVFDEQTAITVGKFALATPLLMLPMLIGRLSGAFTQSPVKAAPITEKQTSAMSAAPRPITPPVNDPLLANQLTLKLVDHTAMPLLKKEQEQKPESLEVALAAHFQYQQGNDPITGLIQKVAASSALKIPNLLIFATNKHNSKPDDPISAAEIVLLNLKISKTEAACKHVSHAITLSLKEKHYKLAAKLFIDTKQAGGKFTLSDKDGLSLAKLFQQSKRYHAAALTLVSTENYKKTAAKLEPVLLKAAQSAIQNKKPKDAIGIYKLILNNNPNCNAAKKGIKQFR